jgi:UDP-glucuronate decarboxylase
MKRILVTGGAGFLGSHLCERLIAENNQVICVDNFHTGARANVEHLLDHSAFQLIEHDVIKPLSFAQDLKIDQIYNLACPASPVHYQENPLNTINTSFFGALNCLELAQKTKAKLLQASTSEVYGDPKINPQPESYWGHVNPIGPRACYDEGKRIAETLLVNYHQQFGLKVKIMRIFNTYGPKMHPQDGRVVSNFIVQALRGEDLTVYGKGDQTRSFCFVSDLIDGMIKLMNSEDDFIGPCNIGNPGEFTILELAEMILNLIDTKSKICYKPLPQDDPMQRRPDITIAQNKLNWRPGIKLQDGLVKTIDYFKTMV